MKMTALIVDDERLARKELRGLLSDFAEIEIVGEADSIRETVALIGSEKPKIVFLDVQLAGETGFDLFDRIDADFKTVFVTAFDRFALRAFEVSALDYLLKPVNPERLKQTVARLLNEENKTVAANLLRPLALDDRLFVETGARSIFLKINEISHIVAANDYSEVFTVGKQKFLVEKPLREWEARLPEKHFARIHRGTIVNLELVERVESWFNRTYRIYLQNNREPFAVSRRCAAKLKEKFG